MVYSLTDNDFTYSLRESFKFLAKNYPEDLENNLITQEQFLQVLVVFIMINTSKQGRTMYQLGKLFDYLNRIKLKYVDYPLNEDRDNSSVAVDCVSKYVWSF